MLIMLIIKITTLIKTFPLSIWFGENGPIQCVFWGKSEIKSVFWWKSGPVKEYVLWEKGFCCGKGFDSRSLKNLIAI